MTDRLPSGSARLDSVLDGGLPLHGITLLIGAPGTGSPAARQMPALPGMKVLKIDVGFCEKAIRR